MIDGIDGRKGAFRPRLHMHIWPGIYIQVISSVPRRGALVRDFRHDEPIDVVEGDFDPSPVIVTGVDLGLDVRPTDRSDGNAVPRYMNLGIVGTLLSFRSGKPGVDIDRTVFVDAVEHGLGGVDCIADVPRVLGVFDADSDSVFFSHWYLRFGGESSEGEGEPLPRLQPYIWPVSYIQETARPIM